MFKVLYSMQMRFCFDKDYDKSRALSRKGVTKAQECFIRLSKSSLIIKIQNVQRIQINFDLSFDQNSGFGFENKTSGSRVVQYIKLIYKLKKGQNYRKEA